MAGRSLGTVTLLVAEYDEALAWFTGRLGFSLVSDKDVGAGKRRITITAGDGTRLLLARAEGEVQQRAIGRQTGDRVGFFLETDDFARDHAAMLAKGVAFKEAPRHEVYGSVAVFADLYGNLWDLIQPKD